MDKTELINKANEALGHISVLGRRLRKAGLGLETLTTVLSEENIRECDSILSKSELESIITYLMKIPNKTNCQSKPILDPIALQGPIGRIITKLDDKTEAHQSALLVQFLTAFGNAIGDGPHFTVSASKHKCNLFTCVVGNTAKGRKGLSWGIVKHFMKEIDPNWTRERLQHGLSSGEGLIFQVSKQVQESSRPPSPDEV